MNKESRVASIAYAFTHGANTSIDVKTIEGMEAGWWWLRSPGDYQDDAAFVGYAGYLVSNSVDNPHGTVRPGVFCGCTGLENITIPESVKGICSQAFFGCISLTSVTIPKSVTRIHYQAFQNCMNFLEARVPETLDCQSDCFPEHTNIIRY